MHDGPHALVEVVTLEAGPPVVKAVTKFYPKTGNRTLSFTLIDDVIVDKSMTYKVPWNFDLMK